jgi:hypothetical protein
VARVRRAFRLPLPARLGLRARITFAFAATTAVLAALLAGTTWGLTRENLINQREASATRQATLNATVMSERVQANQDTEALVAAMASLQTPASSRPSVELRQTDDTWRSVSLQSTFGQAVIPDSVRDAVTGGDSVRMRVTLNGEPELIVGIPVNEGSCPSRIWRTRSSRSRCRCWGPRW